jgi:hypothetical protein
VSDSLIVIAAVRDQLKFGRVHPAYLWFGSLLIAEHVAEVFLYDTAAWRSLAQAQFALLARVGY